jgi:site-specific recombinase XerD
MPDLDHSLKKAKSYLKNTKDVLPANKSHILKFVDRISAEGLSKARQIKYIYNLKTISILLNKDFDKATKSDIEKLCSKINNSNYTEWTKHDFRAEIKRFYKWLKQTEDYPPEVRWLKNNMKKSKRKLPKELLTIDDVKILAESTNNLRDRSLILVLYETGARVGELQGIKIKDVDFDKYGALVNLSGKTGSRKVRIIASAPSISNWLLEHPNKDKKTYRNSYLFCGLWGINKGKELQYRHLNKLLKEAGEKAGILKPLNPHHFRHSRATELAKKLTEAQLCEYMGWVQGSNEASTYVHLSGRDTDRAILEMHGLAEEETEESKFKPIICPRCNIKNDASAKVCMHCSLGLDEESIMQYDRQKEQATKMGLGIIESGKDTQDKINQALMDELKLLRNEMNLIKNKK